MATAPRRRAGIIGASGYTGAELLRLLAGHPTLDVVVATADSQAGMPAAALYPSLAAAYPDLELVATDDAAIDASWGRPMKTTSKASTVSIAASSVATSSRSG